MSARAQSLQSSGWQGVFYLTGGGSQLISELLTTPGASKTVLEVGVPYAGQALAELLGSAPEQASSATTARAMAMRAFQRAKDLGSSKPFGLGCTAGLATDRVKRGSHRAHVALQTPTLSLDLRFDFASTREEEEAALLEGLWYLLAEGLGLELPHHADAPALITSTTAPGPWRALLSGEQNAVLATPRQPAADPKLLLPGSFNPLHAGHRRMLEVAEAQLQSPGAFELSIANVDKPSLDYSTIRERVAVFKGRNGAGPVWLTTLPTFIEKARRFPGATFAVGVDTIVRVAQPRYYDSTRARNAVLREFATLGTRFLVFGRMHNGTFQTLEKLRLPSALRTLCTGVDEERFREDLSSTVIRQRAR